MHREMRFQAVTTSATESVLGEWGEVRPTLLNTSMVSRSLLESRIACASPLTRGERCPQFYQPDALVTFDYEGIYLGFANVIGFSSTNRSLSPAGGGTVNAELCFSVE